MTKGYHSDPVLGARGGFDSVGGVMRSRFLRAGLLVSILAGCASDGSTGRTVYSVTIHGGDDQNAPAGGELAQPLAVTVTDPGNLPVRGVAVRFRVATGTGATLSDTVVTSGLDGVARVTARLGPAIGSYEFIGYISGRADQGVPFSAEATAPPTLTAAAPDNFSAGDTITLRGTDFNESVSGNEVFVAGIAARIIAGTSDTLAIVIPPCVAPGPVAIAVRVGNVTTNSLTRTYASTGTVIELAELQGVTVSGAEVSRCLKLIGGGARYLLVPNFASADTGPAPFGYTLGSTVTAPPPARALLAGMSTAVGPQSLQQQLDRNLRWQEHLLSGEGQAGAMAIKNEIRPLEALTLNSTRTFKVLGNLEGTSFLTVSARLKYIGNNILLYLDTQSPSGGFSEPQLTNFGKTFDETLYQIGVNTFGTESDVDNNGRVIVLLTPKINALTPSTECSSGFVTGYFLGYDIVARTSNSNKGEVFFALVPDPNEEVSCRQTVSNVQYYVPSTFIHELQHMISFNQHVIVRNSSDEDLWLNEGLSHMAEELTSRYYEDKCPPGTAGCRSTPTQLLPDSAGPFFVPNLRNAYDYLTSTSGTSVTTFSQFGRLSERGAAWLFLRWLGDHKGDQIFGRLVQTSKTSVNNVEDKAGESFASLFGDFSISLYTDSLVGVPRTSVPLRYRFTSRNFRFLFARLNAASPTNFPQPFPFFPQSLTPGTSAGSTALAGTMAFWELLSPGSSTQVAIQFAPTTGTQFPSALQAQIGVFRLRP